MIGKIDFSYLINNLSRQSGTIKSVFYNHLTYSFANRLLNHLDKCPRRHYPLPS